MYIVYIKKQVKIDLILYTKYVYYNCICILYTEFVYKICILYQKIWLNTCKKVVVLVYIRLNV